jgi:hypothetical protein
VTLAEDTVRRLALALPEAAQGAEAEFVNELLTDVWRGEGPARCSTGMLHSQLSLSVVFPRERKTRCQP